jgi:hypothetical protein
VELDGTPVPTPLRQAELTVVPAAVRVAYPKQ